MTQGKKKHGNSTHHPTIKTKESTPHHPTQPNPSICLSLSSMAQLDQNLCRRKKNKKQRMGNKREKLDVFKCPPTKPTIHLSPFHSFSLITTMFPELPFCKPPKNPIFITALSKQQYFSPSYVGFLGFFVSVRVSHRENRKARTFLPLPLFSLSWASLFLFLSLTFCSITHHPSPHPTPPTHLLLSLFLPFPFSFPLLLPCASSYFSLIS